MSSNSIFSRLYTGEGGINFVGRRRLWYYITGALIIVCFLALIFKGFTLGIDFQGGTKMNMPAGNVETSQAEKAFTDATGVQPQLVQIVGSGDSRILEITSERLNEDQISQARQSLFDTFKPVDATGVANPDVVGDSTVSESWGSTITTRMLWALGAFFLLIFIYISFRFERDMAIAALAALAVDGVLIAGTYSIIGFEVSPATVIGMLTVLSFSLYDTVVVFDKVKENTAGVQGSIRRTYGEQANLAVNQTVMRSISTTLMSALPIAALMIVAVWLMGVGTLKDLALVQLIGVIEGTFSSVFLATPILVSLKNLQADHRRHNEAVAQARERSGSDIAEDRDEVGHEFDDAIPAVTRRSVSSIGRKTDLGRTGMSGASWRPDRNR